MGCGGEGGGGGEGGREGGREGGGGGGGEEHTKREINYTSFQCLRGKDEGGTGDEDREEGPQVFLWLTGIMRDNEELFYNPLALCLTLSHLIGLCGERTYNCVIGFPV